MKKIIFFLVLFISGTLLHAQDFLDMAKLTYGSGTFGNIDNDDEVTVDNTLVDVFFPVPITGKVSALTGFTYENTRLEGFQLNTVGLDALPNGFSTNLVMTRLTLGAKVKHANKWSGTYVLLPKLASDFEGIGGTDFQIGGLALLEKKYSSRKILKFGTYVSSENFGTTVTPLVGLWYKSRNRKLYIDATLPIRADVNYSLAKHFSVGANLLTSIKSYNLSQFAEDDLYVQEESIRFSTYLSYGFFKDMFIVRGRVGLDTTDFGLYEQGDTVGVQVLTFQVGGDDRNRQNSEFDTAPFVGIDLIFRTGL